MSEHPHSDDELDAELEQLAAEPLIVEAVDPDTRERVTGVVFRDHLAKAMIERDEQR